MSGEPANGRFFRKREVLSMDKMISDLRKLVRIRSICEKTDSLAHPFGESVHRAVETALEICSEYGFHVKNNHNMTAYAEVGEG